MRNQPPLRVGVLHWRYALFTLGVGFFVVALTALEEMGWSRNSIGGLFMTATVVVYAAIGLACRTTDEAEYYVAGRSVPAFYNGMAIAADWMSAASFIGTAGVIYLQGFDGLAYILGWTGGFCMVAMLLAPYLRRLRIYTIPDFLGHRYGGQGPRLMGAAAAVLVSFVYLVVQIYSVGLITSHLTGFNFEMGVFVGLGGVLICSFLGGMRAVTWTQVAQYIILIIAYLTPVVWLSIQQTDSILPLLSYSQPLQNVTAREKVLRDDPAERSARQHYQQRAEQAERKLQNVPLAMQEDALRWAEQANVLREQDAPQVQVQHAERLYANRPRTEAEARARYERERDSARTHAQPLAGMPPQAQPYAVSGDPASQTDADQHAYEVKRRNFVALMLCLMLGTAAMPHVLTRFLTTPTVSEARRSVAWSLFFIALLYLATPVLAVMIKAEVFTHLVGTPFEDLPSWIRRWARIDPSLVSVEDINGDGLLQLAELHLGGDLIVLAAPEIGGLPLVVTYLVAAGALAAALSTADGLLLSISNVLSHDIYHRLIHPHAPPLRRVMLSKFLVLVVALFAAFIASLHFADILQFVAAAFSIAASAFFPALVVGIFWARATRRGASAAMAAGLVTCFYYMATTHEALRTLLGITRPVADCRWWDVEPMAAAIFGVPVGCLVLVLVSWWDHPPGRHELAVLARLRQPSEGLRYQEPPADAS
ncbi:VC_2705 family sodium/solute symporter [Leptothrix ochracea]|uniref:VC_2705 family sodium/solute symporter n=1 Tax=Leptothrix ochracea TaxID=735331 RepID=UPI0034E1F8B0